MIALQGKPKQVQVGAWHIEHAVYLGGKCIKAKINEVRFDGKNAYVGLLHGFMTEGDVDGMITVALVEKDDGTFFTPSVTVIKLIK